MTKDANLISKVLHAMSHSGLQPKGDYDICPSLRMASGCPVVP